MALPKHRQEKGAVPQEQRPEDDTNLARGPSHDGAKRKRPEPLTYGTYLRVHELTSLQTPRGEPAVHDEMLFIIVQQAQELWFKQILHDLAAVIGLLTQENLPAAIRLLDRINRILDVLSAEVEVMETLPPIEFQKFRNVLKPASGFESEQFREVEYASGLRDETFLRLVSRLISMDEFDARWPTSLQQAFYRLLTPVSEHPTDALVEIYSEPDHFPGLYSLCEALSEYEVRFQEWRFHHVKLVDRVIGDRSTGTGGSSGSGYLSRTLAYRFFPELWEARNRITERGGRYGRSEVADHH